MNEAFVDTLAGQTNTLGRTEEVVAIAFADPTRLEELYQCYFQPDEWVQLGVSSSFKRIWRAEPALLVPYLERFIADVSAIDQPSVQWTFAQLCLEMNEPLQLSERKSVAKRASKWFGELSAVI